MNTYKNISNDLGKILKSVSELEKKQRKRNIVAFFVILLFGLAILFYTNFQTEKNTESEVLKNEKIEEKRKIDTVKTVIESYFKYREEFDIVNMNKFYADTLDVFHIHKNKSKTEIAQIDVRYQERTPNNKTKFDSIITLSKDSSNHFVALVKCRQNLGKSNLDGIVDIRLNEKKKIYHIQEFISWTR